MSASAGTDKYWLEAIKENRDALERIAAADLPISDDVRELLRRADAEDRR